jgi:fumarate reductase flavoprotein subunit
MGTVANWEADVVVMGGGTAGLAASISATQNGAKVILLEKEARLGGASNHAEGLFGIMTEEARMMSVWYTVDEVFKHSFEHAHGLIDAPLVRTAIEEAAVTIAWIKKSMPVTFWLTRMSPTEPFVWHIPTYNGEHRGPALVKAYTDKADELGVTMLMNTSGKKIITENGRVTGFEAVDADGAPFTIQTKAVIIASGGFNNSKELIQKWTKFDPDRVGVEVPYLNKVGEGILMGMELGADTGGFGLMMGQSVPAEDGNGAQEMGIIMGAAGNPIPIWVNKDGDRFVDETCGFDFPLAANAIYSQRDSYAWSIWDEEFTTYLKENGLDLGIGTNVPVGTKLDVMKEMVRCVEEGCPDTFIADSIPELAKKIGIDPERLQQTVDRYNGFVATHRDPELFKNPAFMRPIGLGEGKVMACRLVPGHLVSIGGLRVTTETEVMDKEGKPVAQGVYACGADVGGFWGDTYEVRRAGAMMSWASTSGRIAGANAAALAKKSA